MGKKEKVITIPHFPVALEFFLKETEVTVATRYVSPLAGNRKFVFLWEISLYLAYYLKWLI